jgi:hypothetical protein
MQFGAPAHQACRIGLGPEAGHQRPQQQLLHDGHARMRRHLEGAQLQQAQAAGGAVGRIQLVDAELAAVGVAGDVDQDVAQRAVDQPGRHLLAVDGLVLLDLAQRDLQLVELVVARLVHPRRLAGGADEQAAEQVAEAGVVVPIGQQAAQHIGPPQERAVGRPGAAHHEVVATAGAGVAAVEHELLGAQARQPGRVVEEFGVLDQFRPVAGGVDVDFDDARVGRDGQHLQARVARRWVAFQHDGDALGGGGGLDGGQQFQVVFQLLERRHEDIHHPAGLAHGLGLGAVGAARVTHLHHQGGAGDPVGGFTARGAAAGGFQRADARTAAGGATGTACCTHRSTTARACAQACHGATGAQHAIATGAQHAIATGAQHAIATGNPIGRSRCGPAGPPRHLRRSRRRSHGRRTGCGWRPLPAAHHAEQRGRSRCGTGTRWSSPRAGCPAAGGSPSVNHRGAGTCARRGRTRARSASGCQRLPARARGGGRRPAAVICA